MNRRTKTLRNFTASAIHAALVLVAAATIAYFSVAVVVAAPAGWNQVWNDEFTGTTLDTTKWDPIFWNTPFNNTPFNNEQQAYRPDHVTVAGGNLEFTDDDSDNGGKSYTSGKLKSKWTKQYGRWKVM